MRRVLQGGRDVRHRDISSLMSSPLVPASDLTPPCHRGISLSLQATPAATRANPAKAGSAARAGVTYLRIAYSDGEKGTLVVSCRLPGSPPAVAEGVSASKGFLYFWNIRDPQFTLFRVLGEQD